MYSKREAVSEFTTKTCFNLENKLVCIGNGLVKCLVFQ